MKTKLADFTIYPLGRFICVPFQLRRDHSVLQPFLAHRTYFSQIISFFIHLKLEIALAIPASNEWNIPTRNPAASYIWVISPTWSCGLLERDNIAIAVLPGTHSQISQSYKCEVPCQRTQTTSKQCHMGETWYFSENPAPSGVGSDIGIWAPRSNHCAMSRCPSS